MGDYYSERLSAEKLRRCYEIAPPRVRQYLDAEIRHVAARIRPGDALLELGCGYGRVLEPLARSASTVAGIDTSLASLRLARQLVAQLSNCRLLRMNAVALAFRDRVFDVLQSRHGLLGEIDREASRDGVIVCKDGFKVTTVTPREFASLTAGFGVESRVEEVDESSTFCEIELPVSS